MKKRGLSVMRFSNEEDLIHYLNGDGVEDRHLCRAADFWKHVKAIKEEVHNLEK